MEYQPRLVPKGRRRLKWRVLIPSFILLVLLGYILFNALFPKQLEVMETGLTICDYSYTQTQTTLNAKQYADVLEIRDYLYYGETLNLFNATYDNNTPDYFIGKTLKLRNICDQNEWVYMLGRNADEQIPLENLPNGFYEVFIVDNLIEKRLVSENELYDVFYTVRRNGAGKRIDLIGDKDLVQGIEENVSILDDHYFFVQVTDASETETEGIYDVYIDPAHNTTSWNVTDRGRTVDDLVEADVLFKIAEALKVKLEAQGLKVMLSRDTIDATINQYGVDGRLYKAYQSKAKHYLELNLNFTTNKDTRGSRVIYSSYSSNRFATSIFKSLMNTTGLVPYGRNTASNIAGVVAASRFSGLDAYPSIREAGGRILVAGTISDLAIEQNSSFNKEERKGMQSLSLELFFISNSLDTSVYQTQFDALVDNIAKGYLKALGME